MRLFDFRHLRLPLQIAVLSDTHGPVDPRIVELVESCELAIHAGDIGEAAAVECLHPKVSAPIAVRGNNDVPEKWPAGEAAILQTFPEEASLLLPGGQLVAVHGHREGAAKQRHARLRRRFPEARAVVYGHSHRQVADCEADPWILNPGAAGRVRTFGGPACMILTIEAGGWSVRPLRFPPAK